MRVQFDHIALVGETLADAVRHSQDALGVSLLPGGQHAHYATHNQLLGLEDGLYFEAIAADPSVPAPSYPRWFGIDDFSGPARLDKWILRTDDIAVAQAAFPEAGVPVALSRGDLRWTMLVPEDGRLPFGGQFPAIIQWHCDIPPGAALPSSGFRLEELQITGPDAPELQARLSGVFQDARVVFQRGAERGLSVRFQGPDSVRVLR